MGGTNYRGAEKRGGTNYRGAEKRGGTNYRGAATVERVKNLSAANRGLWAGLTTVGGKGSMDGSDYRGTG